MGRVRGRSAATAVAIALAALSLGGCATSSASGSCAGSSIVLGDSDLRPGGTVRLSVDHMWRTCEDTGGTAVPSQDVTVSITPAATSRAVLLGRPVPQGEQMTVSGAFDLPTDLPPGDAVITVASHEGDLAGADLPVRISGSASG